MNAKPREMQMAGWWSRTWLVWLLAATPFFTQAATLQGRAGVLLPEVAQRQAAVNAATKGRDTPLIPAENPEETAVGDGNPEAKAEPSVLQEKAKEALAPPSLEERIQGQGLQGELKQFGYDGFTEAASTATSLQATTVPPDYVISPGDTFVVQVFGATDLEYRLVVTREGRLLVPEVGDLTVGGLTFDEAKLVIQENIDKVRIGVKSVVSLGDLHSMQIIVTGEFEKPGSYTVSGLSSLFNTLFTTGGIKKTGSLRNIQVRRENSLIVNIDMYDFLLRGEARGNIFLRHGDVIFVPPIGTTVGIAGEVTRPAIYELKSERTVADVIALAGGLLPTAAKEKPQIRRVTENNSYTLIQADLTRTGGQAAVRSGDLIRVFPVSSKLDNVVMLSGNVAFPGGYQWKPGMRLSDLIGTVDALRLRTEFDVAVLVRERKITRRTEVLYVNIGRALEEPESEFNIELRPRDELIIFATNSPRDNMLADTVRQMRAQATVQEPAQIVDLKGFYMNPGIYPLQQNMRFLDLIRISGGMQLGVDKRYSVLARRALNGKLELMHLRLENALQDPTGDHNPIILANDRVYIFDAQMDRAQMLRSELTQLRNEARYGEPVPIVQISGKAVKPGTYPLTPGMRTQDLIDAAGGLLEEAYGQTASLSRRTQLLNEQNRQDFFEINLFASRPMLQNLAMVLEPSDHLVIREKPEYIDGPKFATVAGEVRFPGSYPIDRRETLCSVIRRAGGFTRDAYVFGTVFTRESVRAKEQAAINKIFDQFDTLLAEVHTSSTFDNDKKLPVNHAANEVYSVIRSLKPPKAEGRMVIDAKAAAEDCDETSDVVLESGDRIVVPKFTDEVTVVGQVYHPASHKYQPDRAALDYINLSGGAKELAVREHAFVVQANGEVMTVRSSMSSWTWLLGPSNVKVTPGATVVVPLSVDRINGREFTQSWVDMFYKAAVSAASLSFIFQ
jgi:protein involved in polysaccharide export with SLBB domain